MDDFYFVIKFYLNFIGILMLNIIYDVINTCLVHGFIYGVLWHKGSKMFIFGYWQLFVANQNKPADIITILVTNRNKLLRLLHELHTEKGIEDLLPLSTVNMFFTFFFSFLKKKKLTWSKLYFFSLILETISMVAMYFLCSSCRGPAVSCR